MHTASRTRPWFFGGILAAGLLVTGAVVPVRAAAPPVPAAVPLIASSDDSFSIRKFMSGLNRRERVVQVCVGTMCLALFILCKKFTEGPARV
jgi:hypothetical protein